MKSLIVLLTLVFSYNVFADNEGAFLDPPYNDLVSPVDDTLSSQGQQKSLASKSNTLKIINSISPVRSQYSRGTCSIFSSLALIEAQLALRGMVEPDIDLSEEWLEYLVISKYMSTTDGSNSWKNFDAIRQYGVVPEHVLPYVGDNWTESTSYPLQEQRCSHLTGQQKQSCFISHFDGNFLNMSVDKLSSLTYGDATTFAQVKERSLENISKIKYKNQSYRLTTVSKVKESLLSDQPVTMGIEFFYGAWNHSKATSLGIGRNMHYWYAGIVGSPEQGSMDDKVSRENRAGHSVLVVGFDDNKVVERTELMTDGTYKTFTYKGVYYIKNSWGMGGFGSDFRIDGLNFPGYGMITYDYAHRYGSFYSMPLM